MSIKQYLIDRLAAIEKCIIGHDEPYEDRVVGLKQVFLPFDVDGSPMEVGKLIPVEAIELDYKTFDNKFLIQQGAVAPIKTYRSNVGSVVSALSLADVKSMLSPEAVDVTQEVVESKKK